MSEDDAVALVAKKGLGKPEDYGPKAPTTLKAVMTYVKAARQRGFSMINEVFAPGMTAMAAPVFASGGSVIGVITIAGPAVRLTQQRMEALGPALLATVEEVARASGASALFKKRA
jgi:DNA-binding IclR family transcriptional regulator